MENSLKEGTGTLVDEQESTYNLRRKKIKNTRLIVESADLHENFTDDY